MIAEGKRKRGKGKSGTEVANSVNEAGSIWGGGRGVFLFPFSLSPAGNNNGRRWTPAAGK
jgi:hypothetical protein